MRKNNGSSQAMYCISRIDDDIHRTYAWRVSMCRRGKRYVRNFSDKKLGGQEIALNAAKQYRDQLLVRHAPITRQEFSVAKRRNNKSGITGVYTYAKRFQLRDGSIRETWYWEANWPTERGESAHESFSVRKYGEKMARQMAIRARERGLQEVEGLYWASERGVGCEVMTTAAKTADNKIPGSEHRAA
ncbi:MAG: AP2/ERF family transcription factor [Pseudomonadales bacterium]